MAEEDVMVQNDARRGIGTVLLAIGLALILFAAGYFAWSEIESARVRSGLRQNVSAAALPTDETATAAPAGLPVATGAATPTVVQPSPQPATAASAPAADVTRVAGTATRRPVQATATVVGQTPTATLTRAAKQLPAGEQTAPVAPVRISIPDLKIDARVVPMGWEVVQTKTGPVSEWVIPKDAAGHHINSAGLGEPGNLVISGHNNIEGQVFRPISLAWDNDSRTKVDAFTDKSEILTGRTIELFDAAGNKRAYSITEFYRLNDTGVPLQQRLDNARFLLQTEDERVTLVTCWPPNNNTHRLIVIAQPAK
jgi:sortase A